MEETVAEMENDLLEEKTEDMSIKSEEMPIEMGVQPQLLSQKPVPITTDPATTPMMTYSEEIQYQPIPTTAKKKRHAIKIINPDTNTEVDILPASNKDKVSAKGSSSWTNETCQIPNEFPDVWRADFMSDEAGGKIGIVSNIEGGDFDEALTMTEDSLQDVRQEDLELYETNQDLDYLPAYQFDSVLGGEVFSEMGMQVLFQPFAGMGMCPADPMMMFSEQDDPEETQLQHTENKNSHAIKIMNPDTNTEVDIPPIPKPTKRSTRITYERKFLLSLKDSPLCTEPPSYLKKSSVFVGEEVMAEKNCHVSKKSKKKADRGKVRGRGKKTKSTLPAIKKKVSIHKAVKPWRPHFLLDEGEISAGVQTVEVYRKLQGILNKLTPQKFQTLAEQALKLKINTEERLSRCVEMVLNNIILEPRFAIMYAKLCKVMSPMKVECVSEEGKTKHLSFRKVLLAMFQKELEKDKKDDQNMTIMQKKIETAETDERCATLKEEMEVLVMKWRKRSLGNMQFMGELFRIQMLSETIFHHYISLFLKSSLDEECLECCATLLIVVGNNFDTEASKERMDAYFKHINAIIKKGKVSPRVRFLLLDVVELRERQWVPRPRQVMELKTIDQIHADVAREETKEKEMLQHLDAMKRKAKEKKKISQDSKDSHTSADGECHRSDLEPTAMLRSGTGWRESGASASQTSGSQESPGALGELPPDMLDTLHILLTSTDNKGINKWIKKNCVDLGYDPPLLVTNLTSAVVQASITGSGDHAVLNQDQFERRMDVVKAQGHYGVAVLCGLQYSVAKLTHPPKLLSSLFAIVYDLDLVDEKEFYTWRDDDQFMYNKGAAVASVKPFFDWLKSDSRSADQT